MGGRTRLNCTNATTTGAEGRAIQHVAGGPSLHPDNSLRSEESILGRWPAIVRVRQREVVVGPHVELVGGRIVNGVQLQVIAVRVEEIKLDLDGRPDWRPLAHAADQLVGNAPAVEVLDPAVDVRARNV